MAATQATMPAPVVALAEDSKHEDAINILMFLGILVIVIAVNTVAKKRSWPVPAAILSMVVSMILGACIVWLGIGSKDELKLKNVTEAAAAQFLTVWLAPIIFVEGYALRTKDFRENIVRIFTHAFVGTTVSTVVVGLATWYVPPLLGAKGLSFVESLAFGAMISATDPVTTLAIFKEERLVQQGLAHLYYSVLGESLLNDAVGITLFDSFSELVLQGKSSIGYSDVLGIFLAFAWIFLASTALGCVLGLALPIVLKYAPLDDESAESGGHDHGEGYGDDDESACDSDDSEEDDFEFNVPEIAVTLLLAILPYLVAESVGLSGIVAIMFTGITARYYAHHNLTRKTRQVFLPTVELVAHLCETYVFIILGLGVFLYRGHYSSPLIFATAAGCLIGRAAHVYPFSALVNRCNQSAPALQSNEQHMLWFAGLRGAIAFICAFSFPQFGDCQNRDVVVCTTIAIVGSSLVFLGWPTKTVMRLLDVRAPKDGATKFLSDPFLNTSAAAAAADKNRRRTLPPSALRIKQAQASASAACQPTAASPRGSGTLLQQLAVSARRFLMTESAVRETNFQSFRQHVKQQQQAQQQAVGPVAPASAAMRAAGRASCV